MDIKSAQPQFMLLKYFIIFVFIFYMPGIVFSVVFNESFLKYYKLQEYNYFLFLVVVVMFVAAFSVMSSVLLLLPSVKVIKFKKIGGYVFYDALILSFFILSLYFFVNYSSDFRHRNRLSEASPLVSILWLLRPFVSVVLISYIIHVCNGGIISFRSRVGLFFIMLGLVLSLTSSLQIVAILIATALLIYPQSFKYSLRDLGLLKLFLISLFVPVLCVVVVSFGLAGKLGYDKVFSFDILNVLYDSLSSIVPRISSSFMSAMTGIYDLFYANSSDYAFFNSAYWTFENRANIIVGSEFNSEDINTLNRYNQLHVFESNPARAGASPGLIASILYFPFFPLGVIYITVYLSLFFVLMSGGLLKTARVGVFSGFSIPLLSIYFMESPLNLFYILDPFFFTFIFHILFFKFVDFSYALTR
jgi:hypothetical protein